MYFGRLIIVRKNDRIINLFHVNVFFFYGAVVISGPGPPLYRGFTITLRHNTLGRILLHERSARRRNLYLTKKKHVQETTHSNPQSQKPSGHQDRTEFNHRPQQQRIFWGWGWREIQVLIAQDLCFIPVLFVTLALSEIIRVLCKAQVNSVEIRTKLYSSEKF